MTGNAYVESVIRKVESVVRTESRPEVIAAIRYFDNLFANTYYYSWWLATLAETEEYGLFHEVIVEAYNYCLSRVSPGTGLVDVAADILEHFASEWLK